MCVVIVSTWGGHGGSAHLVSGASGAPLELAVHGCVQCAGKGKGIGYRGLIRCVRRVDKGDRGLRG